MKAFYAQKSNAKRRGIKWQLTFEQWWRIWERSGKWSKRGRNKGQYCMARKGDCGAYTVGNVNITTVSRNMAEVKPYKRTKAWRQRLSDQMRGNQHMLGYRASEQTKKRMSKALKGRVPGFAGRQHSEATKQWKRTHWKNQYSVGAGYEG